MFTDEQAIDDIEPLQESSLLHGELSLAMFAEKLKLFAILPGYFI